MGVLICFDAGLHRGEHPATAGSPRADTSGAACACRIGAQRMKIALFMKLDDIDSVMDTLETTVEKLKALPAEKAEEVAYYIDTLSEAPRGRFDDLAGCLSTEEADRLEHAINESSERIEATHPGW